MDSKIKALIGLGITILFGTIIAMIVFSNKNPSDIKDIKPMDTVEVMRDHVFEEFNVVEPEQVEPEPPIVYETVKLENNISFRVPNEYSDIIKSSDTNIDTFSFENDELIINISKASESEVVNFGMFDESEVYSSRDSAQEMYIQRYTSGTNPNKYAATAIIGGQRVNIEDIIDDKDLANKELADVDINDIQLGFDGSMDYSTMNKPKDPVASETPIIDETETSEIVDTDIEDTNTELTDSSGIIKSQNKEQIRVLEYLDSNTIKVRYITEVYDDPQGIYTIVEDGYMKLLENNVSPYIIEIRATNPNYADRVEILLESVAIEDAEIPVESEIEATNIEVVE